MHILLLGAGFSHNWGGWLADEVFEYLLGHSQIIESDFLKQKLWASKDRRSGFESALADVQELYSRQPTTENEFYKNAFQAAVLDMFGDMNEAFTKRSGKFGARIQNLLARFDAIFTLNQDLLIERYYTCGNGFSASVLGTSTPHISMTHPPNTPLWPHEWWYWDTPGIMHPGVNVGKTPHPDQVLQDWFPGGKIHFKLTEGRQPYFKLHGSYNWRDRDGQKLLIMGGNKISAIKSHAILQWYNEQFEEYLSKPNTKLMIIGYGFKDEHINRAICTACRLGTLETFIIDCVGVDVLLNTRPTLGGAVTMPGEIEAAIRPTLIGASRRRLTEVFESQTADEIEYRKIMRFFESQAQALRPKQSAAATN